MQRKRGKLVPVSGLDGPVKALRDSSPQAQHHFTQADQVNQLVGASEADPDLGFMARLMALCSLPRTNPGNRQRYVRRNGPYTLGMTAGINTKLPYGNLPRLLLAWICTEAVRTQKRELVLGKSLAGFMRTLGIYHNSGGRGGVQTRLRNQMDRLFHASVQLIYEDKGSKATISSFVADRTEFWWNERKPNERVLWESKIELGEKFFEEIISHPIPLDMNTLKALKRCALGLDLYLWLAYRTFTLKCPLRLTWRQLYRQFGLDPDKASDANTVQMFRRNALRELKKIKLAWPELNCGCHPILSTYQYNPRLKKRPMAYCGGTREWDTTKTNPETEPRMASAEGRSELLTAKDRSGSRPPKCRVAEELARTRREIATRCRFEDLPAAIRLTPGELRITFSGAEDLAAKLVELSQAMAHDWSGFIRAVEE